MKVAVSCDHAGFPLKETVLTQIKELGHEALDCGTCGPERVDYPDFAQKAATLVAQGKADRAILICGSGIGMCISANKIKGIRASVCHDDYSARQGVEHDNLNVLCLGARVIGPSTAETVTRHFLQASFLAGTRHEERLNKMLSIENQNFK